MKSSKQEMIENFLLANATMAIPGVIFVVIALLTGIGQLILIWKNQ